jgi:hypothetical protein
MKSGRSGTDTVRSIHQEPKKNPLKVLARADVVVRASEIAEIQEECASEAQH